MRRSHFALAATIASLWVASPAQAQVHRTDPKADSPAGAIYEIPLDTGRRDAAPLPAAGGPGGTKGGSGGAGAANGANGQPGRGCCEYELGWHGIAAVSSDFSRRLARAARRRQPGRPVVHPFRERFRVIIESPRAVGVFPCSHGYRRRQVACARVPADSGRRRARRVGREFRGRLRAQLLVGREVSAEVLGLERDDHERCVSRVHADRSAGESPS